MPAGRRSACSRSLGSAACSPRCDRPLPPRRSLAPSSPPTQQPVPPRFGEGSKCETENHAFCTSWVADHWSDTLQPALLQHIKLAVIAVAIGFVLAFAAALVAYRYRRADQ